MIRETERYVKKYQSCQMNKTLDQAKMPTTAWTPFERCANDILGSTTETRKGNRYFLTFQDEQTKFFVAEPI